MIIQTERIDEQIEKGEIPEIEFSQKDLIEELSEAVKLILDRAQWFKNIQIENKSEEKQRFLKSRNKGENYVPDFEFRDYREQDQVLGIIKQCRDASSYIEKQHMEKYGAKELTADDLQEFFIEIFRELELYVKLASNIEDEEKWRVYSAKIWPMPAEETVENSRKRIKEIEKIDEKKEVNPETVAEMFREEIDRLDADYKVEIRETGGCHNIPEEKTVVVAAGENGERMYSKQEAEMLTMHELFHSMRAYNGFKAGEKSGFPEIIGLHGPFYAVTEEGGALYREKATETMYTNKEFDYHLRLIAAVEIAESNDYIEEFDEIADRLVELGATEERAFELLARNREALRHQIYMGGYQEEWKDREELWPLLIGKINPRWAEKFKQEIEAGGMLQKPEISPEKLFDFKFKDSEQN